MSLFGNVSMMNAAMRAFQYGASVSLNNLANAATPGYSRQVLALEPAVSIRDGNLILGQGVNALYVQRIRDLFLDNQIHFELGELGRATARQTGLSSLAALFPEVASVSATTGINGAITDLTDAWAALASAAPAAVAAAKGDVLAALQAVAKRFNVAARELHSLSVNLDTEIQRTIDEVNGLSARIAKLNEQIIQGRSMTQLPNGLLDIREQAAQRLAELVGAQSTVNGNDVMVVTFAGGTLVEGKNSYDLGTMASPTDPGRTDITYTTSSGRVLNATDLIQTGRLGGLVQSRDTDVEQARLALDKAAFGIIQRSNEVNRSYVAADLTFGHDLFSGSKASDMQVRQAILSNPGYIGDTRDLNVAGDLASLQSVMKDLDMYAQIQSDPGDTGSRVGTALIDPTQLLNTQAANFTTAPAAAGELVIVSGGVSTTITWDAAAQSLDDIIANINAQGALAAGQGAGFYATFETVAGAVPPQQIFHLYTQRPAAVFDNAGNLGAALNLSAVFSSAAPLNNSDTTLLSQVVGTASLSGAPNLLDLYTTAETGPTGTGTALVDGNLVNWTLADTVDGVVANLAATAPLAQFLRGYFDPVKQTATFVRSGDPAINGAILTAANPLTSVAIADRVGNLADVLNLSTDTNASEQLDGLFSALAARKDDEDAQVLAAQALVKNTQDLQDLGSSMALDANKQAELAQLENYRFAFDAAVRVQYVLDAMLNKLINGTGSQVQPTNQN